MQGVLWCTVVMEDARGALVYSGDGGCRGCSAHSGARACRELPGT